MATKYWVPYNTNVAWNLATNWSTADCIHITGSCTGTTLTLTSAPSSSIIGYTIRTSAGTTLSGTVISGNGTSWTLSASNTVSSGTKMVAYIPASASAGQTDDAIINQNSNSQTGTATIISLTNSVSANNLNFSGFSGQITATLAGYAINVYGNLTFSTGMTFDSNFFIIQLLGSTTAGTTITLTTNNNPGIRGIGTNNTNGSININNASNNYVINGVLNTSSLNILNCTSFTANSDITCVGNLNISGTGIPTVGTVSLNGAITCSTFTRGTSTGTVTLSQPLTVTGTTVSITGSPSTIPTIYMTSTSSSLKNYTCSVPNTTTELYLRGGGTGQYSVNGNLKNLFIENTSDVAVNFGSTNLTNLTFLATAACNATLTSSVNISGSLTLNGTTAQPYIITSSATPLIFTGTGNIISNGKTLNVPVTIQSVTGTTTIVDTLTLAPGNVLTLNSGTLTAANNSVVTIDSFKCSGTSTRALNMNASTWIITGVGFVPTGQSLYFPWYIDYGTFFTFNQGSEGSIVFTDKSNSNILFAGGNLTYGKLRFERSPGTGTINITGNNTFRDLTDDGQFSRMYIFAEGSTTTFTDFRLMGTPGNTIIITASATNCTFQLANPTGKFVIANYINVQKNNAVPNTFTWYASKKTCPQPSGSTGWIWGDPGNTLASQGVG